MIADANDKKLLPVSVESPELPESLSITVDEDAAGDVLLPYTVPHAEYMYGCVATSTGMLLGYYDLYGYTVNGTHYSFSDLIPGTISIDSRGSDGGSIYDMTDPSVLTNFIASTGYTERFYNTSKATELPYTFVDGDPTKGLNISAWDCLADYLGTGQYWRGSGDLSTSHYYGTLNYITSHDFTTTIDGVKIPAKWGDFKYGLSLYMESVGYKLDGEATKVVEYKDFSFSDLQKEIDAGRPVLASMNSPVGGHMVIVYGYNAGTRELIFDDTYESDCRMTWDGTYYYSNATFSLNAFVTIVPDVSDMASGGTVTPPPATDDSVQLYSGGKLVSSAAHVSKLTLQNGGVNLMRVSAGGKADSTTVNSGGYVYILSGGAVDNTTVNSSGFIYISSGGIADHTTVNSDGWVYIFSGGTACDVEALRRGNAVVYTGAYASDLQVANNGWIYVSGSADNATVGSRGYLRIASGGVSAVNVLSAGRAYLSSGGWMSDATVAHGGILLVVGDATAKGDLTLAGELRTTDHSKHGNLDLENHTLTLDLRERSLAGPVFIDDLSRLANYQLAVTVSGKQYGGNYRLADNAASFTGSVTVHAEGGKSVSLTVNNTASLGSLALSLSVVDSSLMLNVENSGTATAASAAEYVPGTWSTDWAQASAYAAAHDLPIFAYYGDQTWCGFCGYMNRYLLEVDDFLEFAKDNLVLLYDTPVPGRHYSGAPAGYILDSSGAELDRRSGFGAGAHDSWMTWLKVTLGKFTGIYSFQGSAETYHGTTLKNSEFGGNCSVYACSATLTDAMIFSGASLSLFDHGSALRTVVSGEIVGRYWYPGYFNIFSGGTATSTTLSIGSMCISSGGMATATTVNSNGRIYVYNGGTANSTTVNSGGFVNVESGGVANETALNDAWIYVSHGGAANDTTVNSGGVVISNGAVASGVKVNSSAWIHIYSGGAANDTTVNSGGLVISPGGVASNANVSSDGRLYVYSGGTLTGSQNLTSGANVYVYSGGIVELDVTKRTTADAALINDISIIRGVPEFRVTVASGQASGSYRLAGGAANFDRAITVVTDGGAVAGTTTVDSPLTCNNTLYGLSVYSGTLFLTVGGSGGGTITTPEVLTVTADVTTPTNQCITVKATFNAESVTKEYSFDQKTWQNYTAGVTVCENGTVYFRAGDGKGKYSAVKSYEVANIDTVAPEKPVASADVTAPTEQCVTVTAKFSNDSVVKEYSLDNKAWQSYTAGVTLCENGTVYFRAADAAGNVSEVVKYEVANISIPIAEVLTVTADVTTPTNQCITVKATFNAESVTKEYSFDQKTWQNYTTGVTVCENGTVYFRAADGKGNYSAVRSYEVANIDTVAPDKPVASADITAPTEQCVTVTATFSNDSVVKEYSLDNKAWQSYTAGVTLCENGTVYFRGIDAAGNISEVGKYDVTNISVPGAAVLTVTADVTAPTNQCVTVAATFSRDSVTKEYSFDQKTWRSYTGGVTICENGTVYFRAADGKGEYSAVKSYEVDNIDTVAPEKPVASANITAPTKNNVTVTATFSNDSSLKQYSFDNSAWLAYTSGIVMTANGTVYFRAADAAGNVSEVAEYEVANIDKTAPAKPSAAADITAPTNKVVTVTATFSNDSDVREYSLDGTSWWSYTTGVIMKENGNVYFRAADAAGNFSDIATVTVDNIDLEPPAKPSAKADVTIATNKNVTVTATFSSDSAVKEYSLDGTKWLDYTTGVTMSKNGTVYFRAADAAGNFSDTVTYTVKNIVDSANLCAGTIRYGEIYQKPFTVNIDQPGWYFIGSASFGRLNGSITVMAGGKKVASGTVRNGVLNFNKNKLFLLGAAKQYTVIVKNTDKGRTFGDYSFTFATNDPFTKGDNSDDTPKGAKTLAAGSTVNDWVGYGDAVDYYKLGVNTAGGIYDLSLSGVKNNVRLTVYTKNGAKVKSVTASAKKPSIPLADLCLDNGSYAVIEAPKAAKAQNSDYALKLTEKATFKRSNNDWNHAEVLKSGTTFAGALTKATGGDTVDYCDVSALGNLSFKTTAGKVKVSFYDTNKQAVKVAVKTGGKDKTAAAVSLASGKTDNFTIGTLPSSVKYLKIEAAGKTLNSYTLGKIA